LGGGGTENVLMSEYFPLTSDWETDNWTLFIDVREHEINGVKTKAMVDTQEPRVTFWTNDKDGLRMHGIMKGDGYLWELPIPFVLANAVVKVGDKNEAAITLGEQGIKVVSQLVGVEDVTVPAGTFKGCLKFELSGYPIVGGPEGFGAEAFWLARNVGFVKGVTEENAAFSLFTDEGQTRQLLSYHITASNLTPDEEGIKQLKRESARYWEREDLDGLMALYSEDYYHQCRDWSDWRAWFEQLLIENSERMAFISLGDIVVNGENAYAITEYLDTGIEEATGERWWDWHRNGDTYKRENREWRFYGSQLEVHPKRLNVRVRNRADTGLDLAIRAKIFDCADGEPIDSPDMVRLLTITAPPGISIDPDLTPGWYERPRKPGRRGFRRIEGIEKARSGLYTYTIEDHNGNFLDFTDYLETSAPLAIPNLVSPRDGEVVPAGDVLFVWDSVDQTDDYKLKIEYLEDGVWMSDMDRVKTTDTQLVVDLPAETDFRWVVKARQTDVYGNVDAISKSVEAYFSTFGE
jgi:hypothetical protein